MRLLVATRNAGKVRELERLLAPLEDIEEVELVGLDGFADVPDVVEDADTFEGNAAKKARQMAAATGLPTLADDSGLEVDALDGAPGIRSARYAGTHGDDEANNDRLLRDLADVPDARRTARFRCALAFADPEGSLGDDVHVVHGVVEGSILRERRGTNGFGYDPLFLLRGDMRTTAELPPEAKNAVSHRADAARKMLEFLQSYLRERSAR
ncbi:MAG TPA: RdgB/HAM1 family non-canonical purine NTP pyrophosphatase [Sandaracinaceae bacterium LLY-WYZ-13_1]|nr:RdgB/HAM1 family non-canonical purine NTP pyrophosphatase [Sandaracinaceae bacterium LLY-WYZ-13_1]